MDYKTKVTAVSAVLAVLTLTAVLGLVFNSQAVVQREVASPLFEGYQISAVTGLELGNGVSLQKQGSWSLAYQGKSYPVSVDRVETYLKTLGGLQRERQVAHEAAEDAFGLGKDAHTLKILAGDRVIADLRVGATNDLGNKVYVRFTGKPEVWQTDRGFARTLELDFNTWADLSLFPGKKAGDLIRLSFDGKFEAADGSAYGPFDLVKAAKEGKEIWENRLTTDDQDRSSWASLVPTFRFSSFAEPNAAPVMGSPLGRISAHWSDGSSTEVTLYPADDQGRYRAQSGDRDFYINDWALGSLLLK